MKLPKLFKGKKGQIMSQLGDLGIGVATVTIILVVAFLVMANTQDQIVTLDGIDETNVSTFTTAYNGTGELISATATIPDWIPLVIIVAIGGIILGMVQVFRRRG